MEKRITKLPNRVWSHDQKIRACAYVRVSTGNDKQMESLKNQTAYYTRLLSSSPVYTFCGIYSDAGISGAKQIRPGFQAMLEAAQSGELDMIFTKSVSRFARNAVLLLQSVRELKALGIHVYFEEEKIDTLSAEGEMVLTVLATIAEEERKSVCENVRWSVRRIFAKGRSLSVDTDRLLGYDKAADRRLVINEKEAEIIRLIFRLYLSGSNGCEIARYLNQLGIPSYRGNIWNSQRIRSILSNEKYAGDLLLQKRYMNDCGREVSNRGHLNQYFVENDHPAIICREDWNKAQEIRKSRRRYRAKDFSKKGVCPPSPPQT